MRALTWQGTEKLSVETVPDAAVVEPTDAVIRVTSTAICGSDLHLYSTLGMFIDAGDVLGHESMGVVEAVGPEVTRLKVGDRVVVPFVIACGTCHYCRQGLTTQCETTQVHEHHKGASLFGYTKLYGQVAGGQAQYLRIPQAQYGPVVVPDDGTPDERWLYLSDVLPTAWQGVEYANIPAGGTVAVLGLGPIGQMAARVAAFRGASKVIGVDLVPERLAMARRHGIDVLDLRDHDDLAASIRDLTDGRGPDAVIDAVGMEAHGSPVAEMTHKMTAFMPDVVGRTVMDKAGIDRLAALHTAISVVRRGGTVSLSGVYGGAADPMPMMELFDKQLTVRMGQANVHHWIPELMPLVEREDDPLGVLDLRTHRVGIEQGPELYKTFQKKDDGCIKVVLDPWA
ncbi:zinc-dependent alcohol dehydrogenase [Actinotalea sp. C106]|uniref:zinc-dependent alcohol dehydrogenase n=1 Tax=Actinotalea sp. C106 TaxID=2908644 RepID=UPI002027DF08|nr:zinc-dependent alcohol dehydrogenase [Actinotalea sp. C106]